MFPVTRANLDYICGICLLDIRPSIYTKKVYDVSAEKDLCKLLKLTAYIAVLKNPINQSFIDEYCRKICELCYVKSQFSFNFREKILASTIAIKEILENEDIDDEEIQKLQSFCRICLYRQNCTQGQTLTIKFLKSLKDCSGLRFTSLIETEIFRLKEGTNITELMVVHDALFPKQLCQKCIKSLRNMEDFRKQATQSFEYMLSVLDDGGKSPTDIIQNFHAEIKRENDHLQKAHAQSVFECEVSPQSEIKIENEQFIFQELKFTSPDMELYDYYINESRDDSSDEDLAFETNFLDNDNIIFTGNKQQRKNHHSSVGLDPIGKDEKNHAQTTISRKIHKVNDNKATKYKKSKHDQDFKKEFLSDLDFDDSEDSTNLLYLQKRLRRSGIAEQQQKEDTYIDLEKNNIKNELVSIGNDVMEDEVELLSGNQPNKQNNEEAKPTKILKRNKKPKQSRSQNNKDVDKHFVCDQCFKSFRTNYVLKRHIKDMHSPMEANTCDICSKSFRRKHHLKSHIKTVHEKLKPFKCSYCDIAFATRTIKRVHELSHSDTFPFVCDWCARRFRTSSQLKIHVEIHTTQPELLCPICKRSQSTAETLQDHLKTHDEKRLQCPSCGKFFTNSTHLRDHQNAVHLKLRPFKCQYCDSAFGDRKTRRVHEKSHTEDRPEKCSICNRGFKSRSTLGKHIKELGHFTDDFVTKKKYNKKSNTHKEDVKNIWYDG